ncbi:ketopantoate reductase family protein [Streptomyces sp. SKN60]|uniref:ketopantoate reductase family protein n=1 Tax=Streptomyces sp. SKN60 TaxID=2855506 RepID=UPI0022454952|nr:ketopantoate reductase family protein [Streptomyces sp. SKN60]MCX2180163.1 ketopantoate reductase family protein [Streptomyces sp. SKN60]
MKILVVGAGATGGCFGAMLARAGQDVTFLVRPARAAALRERGLRVVGREEEWRIDPVLVTADELAAAPVAYDLVLLSVKAAGLARAAEDLGPAVGPDTVIVPQLNGLAHLEALNERFGADRVLGAVTKMVTTLDQDTGDILRLAPLAQLLLGEQDGTVTPRVEAVRAVLAGAGIDARVPENAVTAMWHKWVFITTIGALTSLMRGTVGEINAVPGGTELATALLDEACAVAAAAGHPVPDAERQENLDVVTATGSPLVPSLYRDLASGAPTEVEHLFGDLVARARRLGVPTPLMDLATLNLRVHQARVEKTS